MNNFRNSNRSGGGRSFGNKSRSGSSDGGRSFGGGNSYGNARPEMHRATCDECGMSCEVPFRPTGEKPVYCSNCFKSMQGGDGGNDRRSERSNRPERSNDRSFERTGSRSGKEMFSAVCDECGKRCEVPFQPTSGKPVYCSDCFEAVDDSRGGDGGRRGNGGNGNDQILKELVKLNEKIDKIFSTMEPKVIREVRMQKGKAEAAKTEVSPEKAVVVKKPAAKAKPAVKKTTKKEVAPKKKAVKKATKKA